MRTILKLFFILLFIIPQATKASHCAGGELIYEWVKDSTYRFFFKFYRDCTGVNESYAVNVCYSNDCNGISGVFTLNKIATLPDGRPNGSPVASGCPGYSTTCATPAGTLPDYREWWYTGTVTIPFRCNAWHFVININARNQSTNIQNGADLTLEATLNNMLAQGNSSPYFSVRPVSYVCLNSPYTYNNGSVDIDNDSMVITLMQPQNIATNGSAQCYILAPVAFTAGSPPYNLVNNPFQTNNSFSISQLTGNINFTPTLNGAHTITIKVSEYRNNKLIGSVMRDIQVQVLNCVNTPVSLNLLPATFQNAFLDNGIINMCVDKPFSFCYELVAGNPGSILVVSDNHNVAMPLSTVSYTQQASAKVTGCFNWYPVLKDTGLKILSVTVKDSTCNPPGVAIIQTFTVPVRVNTISKPPTFPIPFYVCQGQPLGQLPIQGTKILWYNSQVGGTGSITPPSINTAVPGSHLCYITQNPYGCESQRTPITIIVKKAPVPDILLSKSRICLYDSIILSYNDSGLSGVHYNWTLDSSLYTGTTDTTKIKTRWTTTGYKKIILQTIFGNCTGTDSAYIFIAPGPTAKFELPAEPCAGDTVSIYTPGEDSVFYHWSITDIQIPDNYKNPLKLSWKTKGMKKLHLKATTSYNCFDEYDTVLNVYEIPIGEIVVLENNICSEGKVSLLSFSNNDYKYEWSPAEYFNENNISDVTASIPSSATLRLKVTNQYGCNMKDSVSLTNEICCAILLPDAFTPNEDGLNDKFHILTLPGQLRVNTFVITDRWGNIVFNSKEIAEGWDGSYKNQPADIGTYFYYITYECNSNTGVKKGNFILLR